MTDSAPSLSKNDPALPSVTEAVSWFLRWRRPLIVGAHLATFVLSLFLAFLFVNNMHLGRRWLVYPFPILLAVAVPIKLVVFGWFGQFRGWWRYVGIADLVDIAKGSVVSAILIMSLWYMHCNGVIDSYRWMNGAKFQAQYDDLNKQMDSLRDQLLSNPNESLSLERRSINEHRINLQGLLDLVDATQYGKIRQELSVLQKETIAEQEDQRRLQIARIEALENRGIELRQKQMAIEGAIMIDLFATILILASLRMVVRLYHEEFSADKTARQKRLLIVGAGNAGEALLREITRLKSGFKVVGFVDDDPHKRGTNIHGISVLGRVDDLARICKKFAVDEIAIAIPSASRSQLRRVIQVCEGTKLRFRTVPSITDIASGKLLVSQIRDVEINDLLGRDVVQLDLDKIGQFLRDKVILVTGAGGSIGSEMCRQVCHFGPKRLLLLEQAENPLFFIEGELRKGFPQVALQPVIADIIDRVRIEQIFEHYRPQVVIHAAAHKHVPLMEANPGEAVKNNVLGTMTIANAADRFGAGSFVMISTDKAVNPTSIMGSSKRIAEMYIQDLNTTSKTHFITVRFGNVLGSNGSVVPIFKKQIAEGGPVTVTDPEMKRYFMTIPEASQLVLEAASMGAGGEIFVLDMGEPVKIVHLARELITLSGFRPDEDIEIVFTGLRPGEKLFEELSIQGEDMLPTRHPKIAIWKTIPSDRQALRDKIGKLLEVAPTQDPRIIVKGIRTLVPEFMGKNGGE
jgi:FlaA1/EpsC-like NDP-sugar epimerase